MAIDPTSVPLRDHFEARLAAMEKATSLATRQLEERLHGMNEFRQQLRDQAAQHISRDEFCAKLDHIQDAIDDLKKSRDTLAGKASQQSVNVALLLSMLGLLIGAIGLAQKLFGG